MYGFVGVSGSAALLVSGLISYFLFRRITAFARLRTFNGPFLTNFTNLPHRKALFQQRCHEWYGKVCEKYGPIARIAPNILITSSPDVWAHVNNKPGYKRSDWYYTACRIEYQRDNVFTQTDNKKHESRRKQMAPGYSGRENLDLEHSIDQRLQEFLDLIRSKYVSTSTEIVPVDMARKVQYFTLDVISGVGLGKTFGMLQSDSDVEGYAKSSEEGLHIANYSLALSLSWIAQAPFIGRFIAPSPEDSKGFGKMMATCFRYVNERVANPTDKRSDMLASFIRHGIEGDALRSEALEQIVAGSDTTSSGIRCALLHIMTNPRVYAKLQKEIAEAVRDGKAPEDGLITHSQAKQLPYLQATIREALRVWPPVANIFPRDIPPEGDTVRVDGKDVFLPGGACIGCSVVAMQHSTEVFGSDAKAFRPERWFEEDKDKLALMLRTSEMIFGYGKYQCLGKAVAQIELGKFVFEVLRNFDIALINPAKPWVALNHLGLFTISDMWLQVTERRAVDVDWPNLVPGTFNFPNGSTPREHDNAAGRPHHHVDSADKGVIGPGHRQQAKSHHRRGPDVRQCLVKRRLFRPSSCPAWAAGGSVQRSGGRAGADAAIRAACCSRCPGGICGAMLAGSRLSTGKSSQETAPRREEEAGGSGNELRRDANIGAPLFQTALLALVLATISTPVIHALFILFGAPFLDHALPTLLCAAHFSLLGIFPVIYARGVDSQALIAVAGVSTPLDETLGGLLGAVLGAWLGAVPIPLDWDREWQKWPVTIVCGLYAGSCLGSWLSGTVFYGKRLGGTAAPAKDE
ncbi:cytochrome p450 [Trichoderma arundinaceum]|uniref:Cytochrome P450 monooxygenase ABA1 n=1 Tax=Trichoderma arundinaceum TaxID=490622 RepID=A0A395NQY7_TRIAR|nr:cytochrome p450 [Trichoderma arundinaceum]